MLNTCRILQSILKHILNVEYVFCNKYVVEGAVSWESKNQTFVALSSIEVDFVVFALVARERVWLQRLLMEFNIDDYLLYHNL